MQNHLCFFHQDYVMTSKYLSLGWIPEFFQLHGLAEKSLVCFRLHCLQWLPAKDMLCVHRLNIALSALLPPSKKTCSGFDNCNSCPMFLSFSLTFCFHSSISLLHCFLCHFCPCDNSNSQPIQHHPQTCVLKRGGYVNGTGFSTIAADYVKKHKIHTFKSVCV